MRVRDHHLDQSIAEGCRTGGAQDVDCAGACQAACLWFTGLSGSGKSTIANLVDKRLHAQGYHAYIFDGDNVRHGLNKDLGFTDEDRVENICRVAEVARLMVDAGLIVLVSFISPFRSEPRMARDLLGDGEFFEVFVYTPLEVCEARDVEGLYARARRGEIPNFTDINSPYELPERAPDGSSPCERITAAARAPFENGCRRSWPLSSSVAPA